MFENVTLYDWTLFFGEITGKIADLYNKPNRDTLLREKAEACFPKETYLLEYNLIDPLSFVYTIAAFNTKNQRETVFATIKEVFSLEASVPTDWSFSAPIQNRKVRYYHEGAYQNRAGETQDTTVLWDLFYNAVVKGELDSKHFDAVLDFDRVGPPKLTQTLFLCNPALFFPISEDYPTIGLPAMPGKALIVKQGFTPYSDFLGALKKAFPGCKMYEINQLALLLKTGWLPKRDTFWQISSYVGGKEEHDAFESFEQKNAVWTGGSGEHKTRGNYPLEEVVEGDIVLVRRGTKWFGGIGIALKNEHKEGFDEDGVIKILWLVKAKRKSEKAVGDWTAFNQTTERTLEHFQNVYPETFIFLAEMFEDDLLLPSITESASVQPSPIQQPEMPLNTILYGPPGTGKTFRMQQQFQDFTDAKATISAEEVVSDWLRNATWWELLAHVLYNTSNGATVPQLLQNQLIKAKFDQSTIKNKSPRLWSTLQHHTVAECESVKLERRLSPPLFWKEENSVWRLQDREAFAVEFPELTVLPQSLPADTENNKRYFFTTAHQSWNYEDFVEGIKPHLGKEGEEDMEGEIGYTLKDGLFYQACDRAARLAGFPDLKGALQATKAERTEKFAGAPAFGLFIDEINRANISAVLGELITLLEDDKRLGATHEISDTRLPYSNRLFGVPPNLYVIGTMNTADRSVEALDTALRRRFSFIEMAPDESHDGIATEVEIGGQTFDFQTVLQTINKRLAKLSGRDHKIGHSYFIGGEGWTWKTYLDIFTQKIVPLLQEYFYGDWAKMCLVLGTGFVNVEAEKRDQKDFFASLPKTSGIGMEDVLDELQERAVWVLGVSKDTSENDFAEALKLLLPKAATAKNELES